MKARIAAALIASVIWVAPALAEEQRCFVPLSDWQPREALQKKLAAAGWTAVSVRVDDGCYRVKGVDATGVPTRAYFDPATLDRLWFGSRDSHADHGSRGGSEGSRGGESSHGGEGGHGGESHD